MTADDGGGGGGGGLPQLTSFFTSIANFTTKFG